MNDKFCTNCGFKNETDSPICTKCGEKLFHDVENKVQKLKVDDNKNIKANNLAYTSLGLCLLSLFLPYLIKDKGMPLFVDLISPLSLISSIVLVVYGKIKYPKNKKINAVIIALVVCVLSFVLYFLLMAFFVYLMCKTCTEID